LAVIAHIIYLVHNINSIKSNSYHNSQIKPIINLGYFTKLNLSTWRTNVPPKRRYSLTIDTASCPRRAEYSITLLQTHQNSQNPSCKYSRSRL